MLSKNLNMRLLTNVFKFNFKKKHNSICVNKIKREMGNDQLITIILLRFIHDIFFYFDKESNPDHQPVRSL